MPGSVTDREYNPWQCLELLQPWESAMDWTIRIEGHHGVGDGSAPTLRPRCSLQEGRMGVERMPGLVTDWQCDPW